MRNIFDLNMEVLRGRKIAVYGTGKLAENNMSLLEKLDIVCFLDGKMMTGNFRQYKICPLHEVLSLGIDAIVIVATKENTKIIYDRIKEFCEDSGIELYGIHGGNLKKTFARIKVASDIHNNFKQYIFNEIDSHEYISFSLIDVLLAYKILYPTDIFEIVQAKAVKREVNTLGFKMLRIRAEKNIPFDNRTLEVIYEELKSIGEYSDNEIQILKETEISVWKNIFIVRQEVKECLEYAIAKKCVAIICDLPLIGSIINEILNENHIDVLHKIYLSSEMKCTKATGLFEKYIKETGKGKHLHIGADVVRDGVYPSMLGMDSIIITPIIEQLKQSSLKELIVGAASVNDRMILGMISSRLFNSPFECLRCRTPFIKDAQMMSYCFVAPYAAAFVLWLYEEAIKSDVDEILFAARDGYLFCSMYEMLIKYKEGKGIKQFRYFLTSRTAAITAGVTDEKDLNDAKEWYGEKVINSMFETEDKTESLEKARKYSKAYKKYLDDNDISVDKVYGFVDLDSCGTTQYYLSKLGLKMVGMYCHQYIGSLKKPPYIKSMVSDITIDAKKNLFQEAFIGYTEPMLRKFNDSGAPIYHTDDRNEKSISLIKTNIDETILFWDDFIKNLYVQGEMISSMMVTRLTEMCIDGSVFIENDIFEDIYIDDGIWGGRYTSNKRK